MSNAGKKAAVITAFDPGQFRGGIETYTLMLMELLGEMGIGADVYHTGMDYERVHKFRLPFLTDIYNLGRHFASLDSGYDLVISNSFYSMGYFPPAVRSLNIYHSTHAGFAARVEGFIDDITLAEWRCLWGYAAEALSGAGKALVAVSAPVAGELREYYGLKDVRVVVTGVDTELFKRVNEKKRLREKFGVPAWAKAGLFVGRWDGTKGTDALARVARSMGDLHWVLALGSGDEVEPGRLGRNVTVLKEVPREEMREVYSLSDFMVFPSLYEGFGLVVAEAMAAGLPVITTPVGMAGEIFSKEPFSALLLPGTRDPELMARAIREKVELLYDDGGVELRKRLSEEGRRVAVERFSLDRWRDEMAVAIEDALGAPAPMASPIDRHAAESALRSLKAIDELLWMFKSCERNKKALAEDKAELVEKIRLIEDSCFRRAGRAYYKMRDAVLPEGTGRKKLYDRIMKMMKGR